jgi:hypothetical protein
VLLVTGAIIISPQSWQSLVSWNWGSGAPGGKVAETKEHGEIAIQSKRGNTIKKNAEPGNPAVHIARSGNDVVKKASELNVEEKASGSSKKREHKDDNEEGGADGPITENAEGKDVKKQKTEKKSTKTEKKNTKAREEKEGEPTKKETNGDAAPKKKAPGRPKGTGSGGIKAKKEPKPRSTEGIGSRTRSRAWCLGWVGNWLGGAPVLSAHNFVTVNGLGKMDSENVYARTMAGLA